tara:strand:+ start:7168 stop:7386 length:219 start_codon:yes stop_codon:yes gene_type:complete
MKENEFPVLKISNVDWDEDYEDLEKLPKNFELKWGSKNWDIKQVSNWISQKFDWVFHSVDIKQIGTWQEESG